MFVVIIEYAIAICMSLWFSSSFYLLTYYTQKPQAMWWLLQFINQNIEIRIRSLYATMIIYGLKKAPFLHKTGILSFFVTRMDTDL